MSARLQLGSVDVRQDEHGRFNLNDLHRAGGGGNKHRPQFFLRLDQTIGLARAIEEKAGNPAFSAVVVTRGRLGGSYVARQLVYAYAAWISPMFHLEIIDVFDAVQSERLTLGEIKKRVAVSEGKASVGGGLLRRHQLELRAIERDYANVRGLVQLALFPEPVGGCCYAQA